MLERGNLISLHANRVTLLSKDILLAAQLIDFAPPEAINLLVKTLDAEAGKVRPVLLVRT